MNNNRTAAATAERKRRALQRRIVQAITLLIDNGYKVVVPPDREVRR